MFHGTKKANIDQIIQHGFDARYAKSGYLGSGIYCTENSALADSFTDDTKAIFFGRFLLGEVSQTTVGVGGQFPNTTGTASLTGNQRLAPTRIVYHEGEGRQITTHYDSVGALYPTYNCPFWAVYANDQTYPDYLIYYQYR